MNRETKFRLYYQKVTNDKWELIDEFTIEELALKGEYSWDKERCRLTQYTGLKDKNGKEIYEGAIIKIDYPKERPLETNCQKTGISEVTFFGGGYKCSGQYLDWVLYCKVIGNIYENPELMN